MLLNESLSAILASGKVDRVFWAFFQDTGHFFNLKNIDYYGLVRSDFTKKPAYEALKRLIDGHE